MSDFAGFPSEDYTRLTREQRIENERKRLVASLEAARAFVKRSGGDMAALNREISDAYHTPVEILQALRSGEGFRS